MLTISNFSKHYAGVLALSVPYLTFVPGIYWIKGENGSGKTTFFKSLAGMLPCEGAIVLDNELSLHDHPVEYRRRVNYAAAEPAYPGFLTPKDLVRFVGKTKGSTVQEQQLLFTKFGIQEFEDKPFSTCSSGMLKKVSLALAFLGSPKVIILDEPMITLDEYAREILFSLIPHYVAYHQVTFLLSSHQTLEPDFIALNGTYIIQHKTIAGT